MKSLCLILSGMLSGIFFARIILADDKVEKGIYILILMCSCFTTAFIIAGVIK